MIKFEINKFPFALTNDQLHAIGDIITSDGWDLDYDIVEHDEPGMETQYLYLWAHHKAGNPTRYHIALDGELLMAEDVTWDWKDQS